MEAILESVKLAAKSADEAGCRAIIDALQDVCYSLESPYDSMQRLMYTEFQLAAARIGCDLKIFHILAESSSPMSTAELSGKTKAAPTLLNRLLRYMASQRLIREVDYDQFTANQMTKTMAIPGFEGGIYHYADSVGPCIRALPEFLKENSYKDITDVLNCPFQKGHNTDLPFFNWVPQQQHLFASFNRFMEVQRLGMPTWLDVYPYMDRTQQLSPEQPFFVDVGGGVGHQSIALRGRLPVQQMSNKFVLQDMASVLSQAGSPSGIELQEYDFWEPQPVKGARIYYMRNIMHDWPDEKASQILLNTKQAMAPDSIILIDDMVIPDKGAHWQSMQIDITMMVGLSAMERTHTQWVKLIERAGLKIKKVYMYTTTLSDGILECGLA